MIAIPFKRGDTFLIEAAVTDDGTPQDLTDWEVRSQIRKGSTLIAELVVTWVDRAGGVYRLGCDDTTAWPVTTLKGDIEYVNGDGQVMSTETFEIPVEADITLPVVP